jgi:hypothetical protein
MKDESSKHDSSVLTQDQSFREGLFHPSSLILCFYAAIRGRWRRNAAQL